MINEKIKLTRKEKVARKQTEKVLKLMDHYKRAGLLPKDKYEQYKKMINDAEKKCDDARKDKNANK